MRLEDIIVGWNIDLSGLKKGFGQAGSQFKNLDKKFSDMTSRLSNRWTALAGTIGTTALFKKAIGEAVDFQKGMKEVESLLDKDMRPLMKGFSEDVLRLAQQYGEGTDTLTKGLYDIISASVPADQAISVLDTSVRAAKAGLVDTGVAADALTSVLNAYGLAATEAENVSDALFQTVKAGKTTMGELAPAIGRIAPIAASVGISIEEVGAALSTVTRAGVSTDEAVTAVRQALLQFIAPTDEAVAAAAKYGVELSANTLKQEGFINSITKLSEHADAANEVFGKNVRALVAVQAITGDVEGAMSDLEKQMSNAGATAEAFATNTDSAAFAIDKFRAAWEVFGIRFAENILPYLSKLLDFFSQLDLVLPATIIDVQEWGMKVAHFFGQMIADIEGVMGKLPGVLGAPFREAEAEMRVTMDRQKKEMMLLRETLETEMGKRLGIIKEERDATVAKDKAVVQSAEGTTEKLGEEQEKRTKKSKKELQKELDAILEKDRELIAQTVNRYEAQARIEREYWNERNRLEQELILTGSKSVKDSLEQLDEIYAERFKQVNEDMFSYVSKLDEQRKDEHEDNLDDMSKADARMTQELVQNAEAVSSAIEGTGGAAQRAAVAGEQAGRSLTGAMAGAAREAKRARVEFKAFEDQIVALRYYDISGFGAMGGYVSTEGVEKFTLGAYEKLADVFLSNMDRYKEQVSAWVAGGRRGEAPTPPPTAGLEQLASASLKDIRGVGPNVLEARDMLVKLLEYDIGDWVREFGVQPGMFSSGGGGGSRYYEPPPPEPRRKTRRGYHSAGIAPGWGPPLYEGTPGVAFGQELYQANLQQGAQNNIQFVFNAGDAILQRDVKEWVTNEVVPILNELSASGRISFSTG